MPDLIRAEFSRLFKSRVFYVCLAVSGGIPLFRVFSRSLMMDSMDSYYSNQRSQGVQNLMFLFIGLISAVFISLFIGREIKDGTVRNKIVCGYTRQEIYFSELIVSTYAVMIFQLAYTLIVTISYTASGWRMDSPSSTTKIIHLVGIFVIMVYCALFLAVTLLQNSQTTAALVSIVTAVILMIFGQSVYQTVYSINLLDIGSQENSSFVYAGGAGTTVFIVSDYNQPEGYKGFFDKYINEWKTVDSALEQYSEFVESKRGKSLSGAKKGVYLFLNDVLPSCQAEQLNIRGMCFDPIAQQYVDDGIDFSSFTKIPVVPKRWAVYIISDIIMSVLISLVGYLLFERKDVN